MPPEVLEAQQVPDPQPKAGEALIRVKAIGVNFADLLQRMGIYPGTPKPPFIPGLELAGVVERVVEGGKPGGGEPLKPGDAVVALTNFNAYAQWAAVPVEPGLSPAPGNGIRGWRSDTRELRDRISRAIRHGQFAAGRPRPDPRRRGRSGNRGGAAGARAGIDIFGTAGPSKQEYLRKIGVDHAIDYEKSDFVQTVRKFAPDGIEMVMDPIGGKSFARSYECLGLEAGWWCMGCPRRRGRTGSAA